MWAEFKTFALRGNVVDLAVGAATGGLDFSNYYLTLSSKVQPGLSYADAKKQGAVIGYGQFLTLAVNFAIVAAVLFLVIRGINRLKRKEEAKPEPVAEVPADVKLLAEIRDLLSGTPAFQPTVTRSPSSLA
jgi:large conductance mechanosensitive channel